MDILVVEDDRSIADPLVAALQQAGYQTRHAATGAEALDAELPDLVLLDLGLPDMDGYDVCRELRARSNVAIIVVTARGEEFDRVLGLELGADDYVVKPFGSRELIARIRAVHRRMGASEPSETMTDEVVAGPLVVDRRAHRARLRGEPLELTPKEFALLTFLAEDAGAVRTRTDIIEHVWDANWYGPTKTVDAHVAALRRKLGDHSWIEAVRGVGFRLEVPLE